MKNFVPCSVMSALIGVTLAPAAQAQDTEPEVPLLQPASPELGTPLQSSEQATYVRRPSYHYHILAIDLVGLATLVTGAALQSEGVAYGGLAVYALGAPSFHLIARERSARVVAQSALMRITFPILAAGAGYLIDSSSGCDDEGFSLEGCGTAGFGLGIVAGAAIAAIIDNVLLAAEYQEKTVERKRPAPPVALLGPSVAPTAGGASLMMSGAF